MKHLVLTMSLLVTVAAMRGSVAQSTPDRATAPTSPNTTTAGTGTGAADSPLVKAAKSTPGRSKKKKTARVITNSDLAKSGGHVTIAKAQKELPVPVLAPPEMTVEEARALEKHYRELREAAAAEAKKAEAGRKLQRDREAATYIGDDAEGMLEDPALAEGRMSEQKKVETPPPVKPPVR